MIDSLLEVLPELFYSVVAGALATFGIGVEYLAAQNVVGGEMVVGLWMLIVGFVAIYAGIELARDKGLPAIRSA